MRRAAFVLLAILAGCSVPPERQPPVQLQPGLYEVTLGGGTLVELKAGGRVADICLNGYDAGEFVKDPIGPVIERWENCSSEVEAPRGNAMSGGRTCTTRKMPMTLRFTGSHTTDSFEIQGTVMQGSGENASVMHLGSGEFSLKGRRIGECGV